MKRKSQLKTDSLKKQKRVTFILLFHLENKYNAKDDSHNGSDDIFNQSTH